MRWSLALFVLVAACGGDDGSGGEGGGGSVDPPPEGCHAASAPSDSCEPAGIVACAQGFELGDGACDPILPPEACPPGLMALPGETACRPVADCAEPIPVEAGTVYVDATSVGGDGSEGAPFATISEAVAAAADGGLIAIAPGTYAEDVIVNGKAVRLWGTCPDEVAIEGTVDALWFQVGADGSEVHRLALTGAGYGLTIADAVDVLADRVWIHDTGARGMEVFTTGFSTQFRMEGSLLEGASEVGIYLYASAAEIVGSVLRDTRDVGGVGTGIRIEPDAGETVSSHLQLTGSVLSGHAETGLFIGASTAVVQGSVIAETQPRQTDGRLGRGVNVSSWTPDLVAELALIQSAIERNHEVGVLAIAATATLDQTVVRDTRQEMDGIGRGVVAQAGEAGLAPTVIALGRSVIEGNHGSAVLASGSTVTVERSILRDTLLGVALTGVGLTVQHHPGTMAPSAGSVFFSALENNQGMGILNHASTVTVDQAVVRGTRRVQEGLWGDGIVAVGLYGPARVDLAASLVEDNERTGVGCFGAHMALWGNELGCNAIPLTSTDLEQGSCVLEDQGGNACGCDAEATCKAVSAEIAVPPLLDE